MGARPQTKGQEGGGDEHANSKVGYMADRPCFDTWFGRLEYHNKGKKVDAERTVRIVLRDSEHLTSEELIKITRMAEQARSAVRISCGSWRVLLRYS
jgi:hypothetical protein